MEHPVRSASASPCPTSVFPEMRTQWLHAIAKRSVRIARAAALALGLLCALGAPTAAAVTISPGPDVTPEDITQFKMRWMQPSTAPNSCPTVESVLLLKEARCRLDEYAYMLRNRLRATIWELGYDTRAMVRLFELTHDSAYLDHLKNVAEATLQYRDDRHTGSNDDRRCLRCTPPFVDQSRGGVQAAWGAGEHKWYVLAGGLDQVDDHASPLLAYPIAAFARLVTEDASLNSDPSTGLPSALGTRAVQLANASIETFLVFARDHRYGTDRNGYVDGSIYAPALPYTDLQWTALCQQAADLAQADISRIPPVTYELTSLRKELSQAVDQALSSCQTTVLQLGGQPLPYNVSGALMVTFIELFRALDSPFYRAHPDRVASADLVRGLIPLIVARQQRHFVNNVHPVYDAASKGGGTRYIWEYLYDGAPKAHKEDTSHADLDMVYIGAVRANFDRLNAVTAPAGEPIALDDSIMRQFANTFLQMIARPDEIDNDQRVRCNVEGKPRQSCPDEDFDSNTEGWVSFAAVDPTVYRIARNLSLRETHPDEFVSQRNLTMANHSALLANKQHSREVDAVDLTAAAGAPAAAGDPFAWVVAAQDVQDVVYRASDGHVYELWRTAGGIGYSNLSGLAGAPRAAGNPRAYEYAPAGTHNVVYRGTDGHLHLLWWTTAEVRHVDLTARSRAPASAPAGDPYPYVYSYLGVHNVVYRDVDGRLHVIYATADVLYGTSDPIGHEYLTGRPGIPLSAGDPFAYDIDQYNVQNVLYVGKDGRLHGLWWGLGDINHDDVTALSNFAPLPIGVYQGNREGDPTATVTPGGLQHAFYMDANQHLQALFWDQGAVGRDDLSAGVGGAPLPAGRPEAYFNALDETQHVIYRSSNGHLHEFAWWGAAAAAHANLSTLASKVSSVSAVGKASTYVVTNDRSQHVVFRDANGHVRDLSWTTPGGGPILLSAPQRSP